MNLFEFLVFLVGDLCGLSFNKDECPVRVLHLSNACHAPDFARDLCPMCAPSKYEAKPQIRPSASHSDLCNHQEKHVFHGYAHWNQLVLTRTANMWHDKTTALPCLTTPPKCSAMHVTSQDRMQIFVLMIMQDMS